MDRKYIGPVDVERVTFGDAIIGLYLQNLTLGIVEKFEDTRGLGLPWSRGIPLGCVGTEATQQGWMSREIHDRLFSKRGESHHLGAIQAGSGSDAWFIEDARLKTRSVSFGREQLALAPVEYGLSGPVYNGIAIYTSRSVVGNQIQTPKVDTRHLPGNKLRPWLFIDRLLNFKDRENLWYVDVDLHTHATDPFHAAAEIIPLGEYSGATDSFLKIDDLGSDLLATAAVKFTREHRTVTGTVSAAQNRPAIPGADPPVAEGTSISLDPTPNPIFRVGDTVEVLTNGVVSAAGPWTVDEVAAGNASIGVADNAGGAIPAVANDVLRVTNLDDQSPGPMNIQGVHLALLVDTAD